MDGLAYFWQHGDTVSHIVAAALLLMSVSAWVVILWKAWLLQRARKDIARAVPAFWSAPDLEAARARLQALEREPLVWPLVAAAILEPQGQSLESKAHQASQLTRRLRDALNNVLAPLQQGQVLLASIGSTAPFIGLLGTVWGIYHALLSISSGGTLTLERVSGPVGEALIMTAAGLAVAIPAVLAYNIFGKLVGSCEGALEGFAHDLRAMRLDGLQAAGEPGSGAVEPFEA